MGTYALSSGPDNYTGLGQGLAALKTTTQSMCDTSSALLNLKAFFIPHITLSRSGATCFETCCFCQVSAARDTATYFTQRGSGVSIYTRAHGGLSCF